MIGPDHLLQLLHIYLDFICGSCICKTKTWYYKLQPFSMVTTQLPDLQSMNYFCSIVSYSMYQKFIEAFQQHAALIPPCRILYQIGTSMFCNVILEQIQKLFLYQILTLNFSTKILIRENWYLAQSFPSNIKSSKLPNGIF